MTLSNEAIARRPAGLTDIEMGADHLKDVFVTDIPRCQLGQVRWKAAMLIDHESDFFGILYEISGMNEDEVISTLLKLFGWQVVWKLCNI